MNNMDDFDDGEIQFGLGVRVVLYSIIVISIALWILFERAGPQYSNYSRIPQAFLFFFGVIASIPLIPKICRWMLSRWMRTALFVLVPLSVAALIFSYATGNQHYQYFKYSHLILWLAMMVIILRSIPFLLSLGRYHIDSSPQVIPRRKTIGDRPSSVSVLPPVESHLESATVNIADELSFVAETATLELLSYGHWRTDLTFKLQNTSRQNVRLYDIRFHLYCRDMGLRGATIAPEPVREVEIYDTNTIMEDGHIFGIAPETSLRILLKPEITSSPPSGQLCMIFGAFAYIHTEDSHDQRDMRIPSDSVFLFQDMNDGHLVAFNERNITMYRKKHEGHTMMSALMSACDKALRKHVAAARLTTHSHDLTIAILSSLCVNLWLARFLLGVS